MLNKEVVENGWDDVEDFFKHIVKYIPDPTKLNAVPEFVNWKSNDRTKKGFLKWVKEYGVERADQ